MTSVRNIWAREEKGVELDAAIFDRAHLLRCIGTDLALERELLDLFFAHSASIRAQFDQPLNNTQWDLAAHSLKGSARAIGAVAIGRIAEELETIGAAGDRASRSKALARLDRAIYAFATEAHKLRA